MDKVILPSCWNFELQGDQDLVALIFKILFFEVLIAFSFKIGLRRMFS